MNFNVEERTETHGNEFYVHLRRLESRAYEDSEIYAKRETHLRSAIDEVAYNSPYAYSLRGQLENSGLGSWTRIAGRETKAYRARLAGSIASPLWRLLTRGERRASSIASERPYSAELELWFRVLAQWRPALRNDRIDAPCLFDGPHQRRAFPRLQSL